jgi:hypothetical protein
VGYDRRVSLTDALPLDPRTMRWSTTSVNDRIETINIAVDGLESDDVRGRLHATWAHASLREVKRICLTSWRTVTEQGEPIDVSWCFRSIANAGLEHLERVFVSAARGGDVGLPRPRTSCRRR